MLGRRGVAEQPQEGCGSGGMPQVVQAWLGCWGGAGRGPGTRRAPPLPGMCARLANHGGALQPAAAAPHASAEQARHEAEARGKAAFFQAAVTAGVRGGGVGRRPQRPPARHALPGGSRVLLHICLL